MARRRRVPRGFTRAFVKTLARPAVQPAAQEETSTNEVPDPNSRPALEDDHFPEVFAGLTMPKKSTSKLQKLAMEMKIPPDILMQAYDVFMEHAEKPPRRRSRTSMSDDGPDLLEEGFLSPDRFAAILCKLTNVETPEELPGGLLSSCFLMVDSDRNQQLNFGEFAVWFFRHGFNENVLLTEEQREIRVLARKHDLPITTVEKYKGQFDFFDLDRSGEIEFDEFEKLLYVLLRVPKDLDLPASRVRQFWQGAGPNSEGALGFEEFLVFYSRHFSMSHTDGCPVQDFYRGLRRVVVRS